LVQVGVDRVGYVPRHMGAPGATDVERVAVPGVIVAGFGTRRVDVPVAPVTAVCEGVALTVGPRAANTLPTISTLARPDILGFC
jgi:hypothetical protein